MNTPVRKLLTKKELARIFGLISPSGKTIYYKKLRQTVFTDEQLAVIGISSEEYDQLRGGRPFSWAQSCAIIQTLEISSEELAA